MSLWQEKFRVILPGPRMAPIILVGALMVSSIVAIDNGAVAKINYRQKEKQILDKVLNGSYDTKIRPSGANGTGPTEVCVNLFLRSFSKIDDYNMEYSVQLTFREQWLDDRLRFDTLKEYTELDNGKLRYLTLTDSDRIWMPDLFFSNEKLGHLHKIIMPNVYFRIHPNGSVLYSIRISLTLSCPMILKLYPLDKQTCMLRMASYGWTTEDLIFRWKVSEPVQVTKDLHLPRFALENYTTTSCDSHTNTGNYSCLRVDFVFKREFSYYLIQIYAPCCMLVIVSWVSFWLDERALEARVSLGVTTLLTMAHQTSGINQTLPPVSYAKALDLWTGVCLTFVFGSLFEFSIVQYVSRTDRHRENAKMGQGQSVTDLEAAAGAEDGMALPERRKGSMKPMERCALDNRSVDRSSLCDFDMTVTPTRDGCATTGLPKVRSRSKRIDLVSRVAFPVVFALFNLAYWTGYLRRDVTEKDSELN